MLTLDQIKKVGIPKNVSKINNRAQTPAAIYNDSVNLYEAIKTVVDEEGVSATVTGSIIHGASSVLLTLNTTPYTFNPATSSLAGVLTAAKFTELTSLVTLSGVASAAVNLGTFSGSIIPDDSTIKGALQALETNLGSIAATTFAVSYSPTAVTLTVNGTPYAINSAATNAGVMSATQKNSLDSLITLSGVAASAISLGTFTGVTIPDSTTIKGALQALETAVEGISSPAGTNITVAHNASNVFINSSTGTSGTLNAATTSFSGAMTASDKVTLGALSGAVANGVLSHMGNNGSLLPVDSNMRLILRQINYWLSMSLPAEDNNTISSGSVTLGNEKTSNGIIKKIINVDVAVAGTVTIVLNSNQSALSNPPIENQKFIIYAYIGSSGTLTFNVTSGEFLVYLKAGTITTGPLGLATYSVTTPNRYYKFEVVLHNLTFYLTELI